MKPFDLEAAKRGEPVQFKNGRSCRFVAEIPELGTKESASLLFVTSSGELYYRTKDGKDPYFLSGEWDVILAPKKTKYWVNIYKNPDMTRPSLGVTFPSEKEALASKGPYSIKTISFELEE